jgi:hypothetical protein
MEGRRSGGNIGRHRERAARLMDRRDWQRLTYHWMLNYPPRSILLAVGGTKLAVLNVERTSSLSGLFPLA